jgi:PAS domain S-box-containing protein
VSEAVRVERRARELLQRVAVDTARAQDRDGAFRAVLAAVCAHTGWPVGHFFELDAGSGHLVSGGVWHLDEPARYARFREVSERIAFAPGVGLPGRVLAAARPLWIMDVTADPGFARAAHAADSGVRAGFGFPVMVGTAVVAVLEFYSPHPAEPDEPLLGVMGSLGHQLGHLHERLRAEARLASSERRFRSLAESATDAIVTVDAAGRVVSWNPAAERLFGWTAAEAVGVSLERVTPPAFRGAHRAGMARVAAGGERRVVGRTVELAGLRRDGEEFPLELSLGAWEMDGRAYFTGVMRDITVRKDAERRLREQADRLDRQNEELARKNEELVRQREELLVSWRQLEQLFSALADALPGQALDRRYHLGEQIGAGGYGVVYRAVDAETGAAVAIKVFRPANGRLSPEHLARFRREGATATRVNHPNAVRVLDAGVSSAGIPYLVMELLEGETLSERLRRVGPLPAVDAVALLAAIAAAVGAAHASGIVHRDIKADNVFLLRQGGARLLDFGIARLLDDTDDGDLGTVTLTGQMVGTPAYMAPERLRGAPSDARADVYSLGVLLYEALVGARPFDTLGRTPWEIVHQHLTQPVPALETQLQGAPTDLSALAAAALAREPAERPSAHAFAAALAQIPRAALAAVPTPPPRTPRRTSTGSGASVSASPTLGFDDGGDSAADTRSR